MALDRLTKVDGGGISTTSDYRVGIITASKFVGPFDGTGGNFSGVVTATNGVFSGNISAVDGNFSGNVTIGGTLTYEDVTNIDSVGIITAQSDIHVGAGLSVVGVSTLTDLTVEKTGNLNVNIKSTSGWGALEVGGSVAGYIDIKKPFSDDYDMRLMCDGNNNYITSNARPLKLSAQGAYGIELGAYGAPSLQYNNNTKLTTTDKGIQVGTGVTIETSGQATFTGVTTFTHSQFHDYIRIGNPAQLGSNTGSQIGRGAGGTRPASLTFNHGGSATLELGSIQAAAIIGTNSHGANNKPLRFITGMGIGTLTGGTIQMEIKNNTVNIFNDLDVDGHTNLDNVSIAGVTTTTDDIIIGADNKYFRIGASNDLSIWHDGSHSRLKNDTGTLFLQSNSIKLKNNDSTEHYISCVDGGSVELYHANDKKFQTQASGAKIFNTAGSGGTRLEIQGQEGQPAYLQLNADDGDDNADYSRIYHGTDGAVLFQNYTSGNWETNIKTIGNGAVELYHDDTKKAETFSQGLLTPNNLGICFGDGGCKVSGTAGSGSSAGIFFMTNSGGKWQIDGSGHFVPSTAGAVNIGSASKEIGNVYLADSKNIYIGSDQDVYFNHSGVHAQIKNTTGNFYFDTELTHYIRLGSSNEAAITATHNSSVDLYYDGGTYTTPKLKTSATGITVDGEVAATQDYPNFRPTLDLNFVAVKKLDSRITYSRTGPASFINEFGKVVKVSANAPRFDHDPMTRESKGLLVEESRTNVAEVSEDFDDTTHWEKYSVTVTTNVATAPDGTLTADNIIPASGSAAARYLYFSNNEFPLSTNTSYTTSIFVKKNGHN